MTDLLTPTAIQLFVSNRYDRLYKHLHQQLFNTPSTQAASAQAAFAQRFIVTSNPALYRLLTLKLARDPTRKIAMGFQRLAKELLCVKCGQWFAARDRDVNVRPFPHHLQLVFSIEKALEALLTHREDEALCSLFSDLSLNASDTQRRVRLLSESVATLFMDYGSYGADLFETWEHSPHPHAKWQKCLWDSLFGPNGSWHVPYQLLNLLDFSTCLAPKQLQLHLFCHTDLSLLEQTLLQALSLHRSVYIYQLSPTRMYWEDLLSPRAQLHLREAWEKRGVALEELKQATELLQEPNPLLSRLGQALHLRDHQISARVLERHEDYAIPEALLDIPSYAKWCDHSIEAEAPDRETETETSDQGPSLLQALQGDLLLLRRPNAAEPMVFSSKDRSIQLHAAPTPMREVEVIYKAILERLNNAPALQSGAIALYVVDLPAYLPFLRACFESQDSPLKVEYLQLPLQVQSPYIQAFLTLVQLVKERFSARRLLHLLDSPFVHTAAEITSQELKLLRGYIQQAPIYWGETTEAREAFLQKSACHSPLVQRDGVGTWRHGITQLFVDLVMGTQLQESSAMTFSEAPLMEKWLLWFHALQRDIDQLKGPEEHTLAEWSDLLRQLTNRYLSVLDSHQERDLLFERLDVLEGISDSILGSFSFSSILPRLEWLLHQPKRIHHEVEESTVTLSPLGVHRILPARIIGLIGLEEGAFPRKRHESPLDLLRGNRDSERRPKASDQERALLLEALLSAQETLLISYCSTSPHDGKIQDVAKPVVELIDELNKSYVIDQQPAGAFITHHHPLKPYDPRYFSPAHRLSNPAKRDYTLSLLYAGQSSLEREEKEEGEKEKLGESATSWSLRQLHLAAQDPCALYLKEQLNITLLDPSSRIAEEEEPFEVASKTRYRLQDRALNGCLESVLGRANSRGELPYGLFGTLTTRQIHSEVHSRKQRLKQYQLESNPLSLMLHPTCLTPNFDEAIGWQLPALTLAHPEKGLITLTGKLEAFSAKGFLTHGTGTLEERAASWPLYLTFLLLRPELEKLLDCTIEPSCLFLGKEQRFTAPFESTSSIETALLHFIHYAEKARKQCAPLHKDWLVPLLKGDPTRAADMMEAALEETQSAWRYRHILWARKQRGDSGSDLHSWLQEWVTPLQQAYAPLL